MGYCYDTGFTSGITHGGTAKYGRPTGYSKHTNITVSGCTFSNCGGPGLVPSRADTILIDGNLVDSPGSKADSRMAGAGDGCWPYGSSNVTIQHNQFKHSRANTDACGIHIDSYNTNVLAQYNLSVDNEGGFVEVLGACFNVVIRYNVSVNDGSRVRTGAQTGKLVWFSMYASGANAATPATPITDKASSDGISVYNNTAYVSSAIANHIIVDPPATNTTTNQTVSITNTSVTNNIFIIAGNTTCDRPGTNLGNFAGNVWYGNRPTGLPASATDILADPQVVNAGGTNAEDYRLSLSSPAIAAGTLTTNTGNFTYWQNSDYWGTALPSGAPCMGATEQILSQCNLAVTSPYGTPTPNGTTAFGYGALVNASANSPISNGSTGYVATGYTGTGSAGTGTGSTTSFYITSNSTLDWLWQASYAVTASVTAGSGSISPAGTTYVPQGGSQLFSFTAATGFVVSDVKVDGISAGAAAQYTFTNVTAPHTLAISFAYSPVLIDHTFNGGSGTLNGTTVTGGTLVAGNPALAWVADSGTVIAANGTITAASASPRGRCAYIPLGGSIANGNIYELTMTMSKPTSGLVSAGFFDSATPAVLAPMDWAGALGTGWFQWDSAGNAQGNRGTGFDADVGYDVFGTASPFTHTSTKVTASSQTFTIRLDLSAADGTTNWGNMTVYAGNSTTGTVIGGLSNVAFTSAQHFLAAGFAANLGNGSISRLTLAQIVPAISIVATAPNASKAATPVNGTFTLTRSVLSTGTTTVNLTIGGTASSGFDYASIANTVTFAPGETTKTITITPLDNPQFAASETVTVALASGVGYTIGSPSSDVVTIAEPPYNAWISTFALTPSADRTASGNPSGDGIPNLVKYALGLNPTAAATNPVTMSQVVVNGGTYLQLSVNRNPAVTNILIEGLSTGTPADPTSWSANTTVTVTNTSSVFTVRDSLPIETNSKRFLRLRFTLLP